MHFYVGGGMNLVHRDLNQGIGHGEGQLISAEGIICSNLDVRGRYVDDSIQPKIRIVREVDDVLNCIGEGV